MGEGTEGFPAAARLLREAYGLDARVSRLDGENENYLAQGQDGTRYVLKLADPSDDPALLDLEHAAVEAVHTAGLGLELPRILPTLQGAVAAEGAGRRGRLLAFVSGQPWGTDVPASPERLDRIGGILARLHLAMAGIDRPSAHRTHPWDLAQA
ncbi:MAG TPA: phosphotransferase, partial [Holophaga sp.]|nr:phosphotransferase [Holophaga sp.]